MKFNLRKKTGVNGTEIKLSVLFSPEEIQGLDSINDDADIHLDKLRVDGDDYLKADHALMVVRILAHQADLWKMSKTNSAIRGYLTHGVQRKELLAKVRATRKKKRKRR